MTTHTLVAPVLANRSTTFRPSTDLPLTRSELAELREELRRELVRLEPGQAAGEGSPELDEIRRALRRIDDGTYGVCIACGGEISFGRLQVMPATQRCVRCAR